MGKRSREAASKAAEAQESSQPKAIKVDDTLAANTDGTGGGAYNKEEEAWEWSINPYLKLRVSKFKGQTRVDIRTISHGNYTKKGISLSLEAFEAIRNWDKYPDALKAVNKAE
eukprot:Protomagalhaensia_sp_Gyna_25__2244@NODE_2224_length_1212_cov_102_118500_g1844_i0_p1_GENE_NODE_2224_length_1212_cov_102_118500_g1844_i0NODE_2224_length_1212_cov_102_118500_g1844_i0_p1_ORF_typecomplete_len113_score26_82PC4/PF02229_16/3_2e08_NODE_2224_length_1212_cov_102_118500_g1844_i0509847